MHNLTRVFKALSDGNRLRILKMLEMRPLCVCEVREVLQLAVSTVSKHLSILRDAGLIRDAREGKWAVYSLNPEPPPEVASILELVRRRLAAEPQIQQDQQKIKSINRWSICCIPPPDHDADAVPTNAKPMTNMEN